MWAPILSEATACKSYADGQLGEAAILARAAGEPFITGIVLSSKYTFPIILSQGWFFKIFKRNVSIIIDDIVIFNLILLIEFYTFDQFNFM